LKAHLWTESSTKLSIIVKRAEHGDRKALPQQALCLTKGRLRTVVQRAIAANSFSMWQPMSAIFRQKLSA